MRGSPLSGGVLQRRMGLGLAALGRPGYINLDRKSELGSATERPVQAMRERTEAVLDAAWKEGVRWFDCARSYGLSEEFVGGWLRSRGVAPADVVVSSKWGYRYVADWQVEVEGAGPHEVKEHTADHFEHQLQETLEHVGEYVRLYQIHSATFESGVLENDDVLAALAACKREHGWAIGLSLSSPAQAEVLRQAVSVNGRDGSKLFDSCQVTYNCLEQSAHAALCEARDAGLDIIVKEGLANGRLLPRIEQELPKVLTREVRDPEGEWESSSWSHEYPELKPLAVDGWSHDQLALAAILAQPFEPYVLSGAVTCEQLRSNLAAEGLAEKLRENPALLAAIMAGLEQCAATDPRLLRGIRLT